MAESGRRYTAHDVDLAREIAHHAAVAIERARLYRAAQMAVDARNDLLAFVTHDLHNYLATIQLSAGALIGREAAARGQNSKQLDLLARTVTLMSRLIEGLRDATTIETGQFTIATAPHDIAALVADAVETLAPQAAIKSLRLTAQVDDELPEVVCDRDRVLQVIANLVGNAIKFTPARGAIRLRATRAENAVEISIHDSGTGIPESELPRVFDRYWKSGETAGTGLGLFIARGIVQAHGGRIWAESTPGTGSAFRFTLPIASTHRTSAGGERGNGGGGDIVKRPRRRRHRAAIALGRH
jgi:signal transduction histidine kinase